MTESETRRSAATTARFRRRKSLIVIASLSAFAVLSGIAVAWISWPPKAAPSATATPTIAPSATQAPVAVGTDDEYRRGSDLFDWWSLSPVEVGTKLSASNDTKDGSSALLIVSEGPAAESAAAVLRQQVSLEQGASVTITLWAKATNQAEGAVVFPASPDGQTEAFALPGGTYDWTEFRVEYGLMPWQSGWEFQIIVAGATESTLIDGLSITSSGSDTQRLANSSFETNSAELMLTNPSLMFIAGAVPLQFETRQPDLASIEWTVTTEAGADVVSDTTDMSSGVAIVHLNDLEPGYYRLSVHGEIGERQVDRKTAIVVAESFAKASLAESHFGVQVHVGSQDRARLDTMFSTLSQSGIGHVRIGASWDSVEAAKGSYVFPAELDQSVDAATGFGMSALQLVGWTNYLYDDGRTPSSEEGISAFSSYATAVANQYPTGGQELEVYSEYNHIYNTGTCGKSAVCYLPLLSQVSTQVKAAHPDAKIVAPNLSGMGIDFEWMQSFVDEGGLSYTDVVSVHPYVQPEPPEVLEDDLARLNQMIADGNNGRTKTIWFTEMGWSSVPGWVTEQQQADYLVRMMAIGLDNGVDRIYWYNESNTSLNAGDRESNFGLFEGDTSFLPYANSPKPVAAAQTVMARQIQNRKLTSSETIGEFGRSYVFSGDEDDTYLLWSTGEPLNVIIHSTNDITVVGTTGEQQKYAPTDGKIELQLSSAPVYVSGTTITGIDG